MMGDCVTPRHSAVMERLRRRIELFRQHHNSCESQYERASLERLELDRQQTYALHQRCLQAKAKRSSKQRQSQPTTGEAPGGRGLEGAEGPEQSRNTTLAALQETVKRKIERAASPLGRDVNGFGDGFPPSKKQCLDNSATNGSPLDSKLGLTEAISANGKHESSEDAAVDFHPKELKQEPDDILPIMPPSGGAGGAGSLFPDLNLNEQEWSELMEELNCTVAYEDIQDILNDDDPLELTPAVAQDSQAPGAGGPQGPTGGAQPGAAAGGRQAAPGLLPPDLSTVKAEFSPASLDSHSPLVNVRSSVNPSSASSLPNSSLPNPSLPPSSLPPSASSVPPPSSTSPALHPQSQSSRPLQNHLLPSKDLSPAQQLQQLAAQQRQQHQHLHGAQLHKPNQPGAKFHPQAAHSHQQAWAQMGGTAQSPITGGFNMDNKPSSPSLYQQDMMFNTSQNQLLLPSQAGKGSPKAGSFLQGGPSVMAHALGHPSAPPPPQQQPQQPQPPPGAQLNFNNTKPLSHYEARGPSSDQSKNQLMTLLRQQQQQQQHLKQKTMSYRPHPQHPQDQNSFGASTLTQQQQQQPGPGAPGMGTNPAMANHSNHANHANHANPTAAAMGGSAAYMNNQQMAAALKQQQQRQQQQQYLQRQQMIEQEKQRQQQDQQLKRHLSRPPPQYKDQSGPAPNQNAYTQPQFTASSGPMGGVASMGPTNPASRMFPPPQGMMGMGGNSVAPPTNPQAPPQTQADMLTANGLYNNATINQQRQQQLYRQNMMMKTQNNAAMLKQQQQLAARLPGQVPPNMSATMNSNHAAPQNVTWNQQMANSQLATPQMANHNAQMPSTQLPSQQMHGTFSSAAQNAFHLQQQQQRLPKMQQFAAAASRPLNAMNPGQQMMQRAPTSLAKQQGAPQPDLSSFGQGGGARGLQCNYGVGRAAASGTQQQQLSCGYNVAAGSFAEESELVDSLLKGQSTQEWMDDLDELLAGHH